MIEGLTTGDAVRHRLYSILTMMVLVTGCIPNITDERSSNPSDIDGDGWTVEEGDCWESSTQPILVDGAEPHALTSADIYPGAPDTWYDGIDSNCDGVDDFDQDGDGFVSSLYVDIQTGDLVGTGLLSGGDCSDLEADIHPAMEETPMDGVDSDCDGKELCLRDQDLDGYGDGELLATDTLSCEGYGLTLLDGDCNPGNPDIYPNRDEVCDGVDSNCDDELWSMELDVDEDGYVACTIEGDWLGDVVPLGDEDCDDENPEYFPGQIWYNDMDGDGYGSTDSGTAGGFVERCDPIDNYTALETGDCEPFDSTAHPFAPEFNDAADSNCDGMESQGYTMCTGAIHQTVGEDVYYLMCGYPGIASSGRTICEQSGYDGLASVLDAAENTALRQLNQFLSNGTWLGADDTRSEDIFVWDLDGALQYSNWYGNHPNVNGIQADCLSMDNAGQWKEVSCTEAFVGFSCMQRGVTPQ